MQQPPRLPNYIRTYRRRACLTQREVAFILGTKSSARISRHERFKQQPDLQTLLAYEFLFRTPVRSLFIGTHYHVERKLVRRIKLLIRSLSGVQQGRRIKRKLEILSDYLNARVAAAKA